LNDEFAYLSNSVDVVWNRVSGEFGVTHQDAAGLVLAQVRVDGSIADRARQAREAPALHRSWRIQEPKLQPSNLPPD
jgi:hypothetical protein